ncbi:MAG: hypothetical protein AB7O43_12085 [Hyphomicrobiaceae bacterium]
MSFSQTNTTNPLRIKRIARHQMDIVVRRDNKGQAVSFVVNSLDLTANKLPDGGRIKLFAYSRTREQSMELGTVSAPRLGIVQPFSIDSQSPFHFRLIVCDPEGPEILASCEGLRATEESEDSGRQHLLPVEPSYNLEEKLWELRIDGDGEPVLYVNADEAVGMLARMRGDPLFQALILPQAVEVVLLELTEHLEDDEGWHGKWNAYLRSRNIDNPDDPDDPESCAIWARAVAQKFANEHKFLSSVRSKIEESSYDG